MMGWKYQKPSYSRAAADPGPGLGTRVAVALVAVSGLLMLTCCRWHQKPYGSPQISHVHISGHISRADDAGISINMPIGPIRISNSSRSAGAPDPSQVIMVVYANNCCQKSLQRACESAKKYGFKDCWKFGLDDLDSIAALSPQGKDILLGARNKTRGAGYWLWKPLVIWQSLIRAADGDIIWYMDADSDLISDPQPLLNPLAGQDVVGFTCRWTEANWTKTDAFLILNGTDYLDTKQLYGGLVIARRSWTSLGFISQWLSYSQDCRLLTNMANTLLPDSLQGQTHPGFMVHRNDQAIFSLLYKKWGFESYPDPSRLGEELDRPYPTIWNLHMNHT